MLCSVSAVQKGSALCAHTCPPPEPPAHWASQPPPSKPSQSTELSPCAGQQRLLAVCSHSRVVYVSLVLPAAPLLPSAVSTASGLYCISVSIGLHMDGIMVQGFVAYQCLLFHLRMWVFIWGKYSANILFFHHLHQGAAKSLCAKVQFSSEIGQSSTLCSCSSPPWSLPKLH